MLNKIIAFSIRNKLIVGIMVLALIGSGIYYTGKLPIDAVPDITNNQVLVITSSPSLGAADIERQITFPIEQATRNIPGIIEQRSFSRFGLSLVTIVFNDKTDVYWARQQISERLIQIQSQIPPSLGTPVLGPVTTGLGEIYQYVVKPKPGYEHKYDAMELRTIQDWIIRRQLLGTEGVADVSSFGGKLKQYEIAVNPSKLNSYNLTISDIFTALEKNNQNTGGAYIEKGPNILFIRSEGIVKSKDEIASISVKTLPGNMPVSLGDVAEIKSGAATRYGAVTYNDQGEVAGAVVMMLKGENSSRVIKSVKEKIAQIEKTLPEGVVIEPFLDRTKMVDNAIHTVETNLLEGALIVLLVLVLFLGNFRAGLLVASVIPLAMLFAIIMMNLFGVSGNLMSLGALDFGLIVDGAVIIVEAVMHRLHHRKHFNGASKLDQSQMDLQVYHSASKMMNAAVFGQIIILIVYLPILSLQGIEGKMFKPMAETVAFAILGAFLLSLTYVPMMSSLLLSKKPITRKTFADKMMSFLGYHYRKVLVYALSVPKRMVVAAVLLFTAALIVLFSMGGEFIPKLEEGDFAVDTRVLTGSSLTTTIESTQQTARVLLNKFPEVEKVVTKIGSGEIPTDPMPVEASDMMVILKPKKEWTSAKSFDELSEKMSKALEDIPGVTAGFQYPVQMRFNELMTGGRQDVVCKIFGENLDTLAHYAQKLGLLINGVEGAKDIYVETATGLPQIIVNYNRAALSQYGLTVEEVNNTLQAAFAGAVSGQVFEDERRFDLVVRLEGNQRRSLDDVKNLLIATPSGQQIPMHQVTDIQIKEGPNQIQREDAQRRITVGFNVRGKDVESVVNELHQKVDNQINLPPAYYITYGGQFENLIAAKERLSIAVPIALLLIFLMLYFAFSSVKQALLIYSAIPLSAIGGVFALYTRGMPFSISAGVGFIALFGVAVLNGIVLISELNQLKKAGVTSIRTRVLKGTKKRLRPVLMTAAVASLGFLPMALSQGAGAEVQRPLATVVIGGLVTATFLTLLILPILYMYFDERDIWRLIKNKLKTKKAGVAVLIFALTGLGYLPAKAQAQRSITLNEALQTALQKNLELETARQQTRIRKKLEGTAWDIPPANAAIEYGQFNSLKNDNRFSVSQSFAFPTVYTRQKKLLSAETESSTLNERLTDHEVKKQVSGLFYRLLVMDEKRKLLKTADSLYAALLERQEQRFRLGEADILEKTTAETQRREIKNQQSALETDFKSLQIEFSRMLNASVLFIPASSSPKITLKSLPDLTAADRHPQVLWQEQQQRIAENENRLNKARLLPEITLGYNNQSLIGYHTIGNNDVYFTSSKRFHAVTAGINIPVFFQAGRSKIQAGKLVQQMKENEYRTTVLRHEAELGQLLENYKKNKDLLAYYESEALGQSRVLQENASLQLANGAINYLEWLLIINQALAIRNSYLEAIASWNDTALQLNSYSSDF